MGILQLLNLVLFWVFFGYLASYLAKKRGRNPIVWFFVGLLLGIFGVLTAFLLPAAQQNRAVAPSPTLPRPERSDAWLKSWYYLDSGRQQVGPLDFPDLAKLRLTNALPSDAYVWGEGMEEWKPLSELPEIVQEMQQQTS